MLEVELTLQLSPDRGTFVVRESKVILNGQQWRGEVIVDATMADAGSTASQPTTSVKPVLESNEYPMFCTFCGHRFLFNAHSGSRHGPFGVANELELARWCTYCGRGRDAVSELHSLRVAQEALHQHSVKARGSTGDDASTQTEFGDDREVVDSAEVARLTGQLEAAHKTLGMQQKLIGSLQDDGARLRGVVMQHESAHAALQADMERLQRELAEMQTQAQHERDELLSRRREADESERRAFGRDAQRITEKWVAVLSRLERVAS